MLVYFPGSDGTGCSIAPQLQGLLDAGWDVRCELRSRVPSAALLEPVCVSDRSQTCTCSEFCGTPVQHLFFGAGLVRMYAKYVTIECCRCLYIPMEDRSDWPALVARVAPLLQAAVDASPGRAPVSIAGCPPLLVQVPQEGGRRVV